MSTISKIEKLGRLHSLIKREVNITPQELAEKLEISTSCLYNYIEELELLGADIQYNKRLKGYSYNNDFEFKLIIKSENQEIIFGGKSIFFQIPKIWKNDLYTCKVK